MTPIYRGITLRTLIFYASLTVTICLIVLYTLFQARFLLSGPIITFMHELPIEQTERVVDLEGEAQNIVKLALNGRQIYTDKNGYFKEALVLENGYTVATLQAHDRYGRTRTYTQSFVYTSGTTE